jgi:hypothetical protein
LQEAEGFATCYPLIPKGNGLEDKEGVFLERKRNKYPVIKSHI